MVFVTEKVMFFGYNGAVNHAERIRGFTGEIWKWYARHKRILPWRDLCIEDATQRAYQILLSEVMLQQTQVERVRIIYKRFLERFPTITDLAEASNRDVLIAWRGMGYNRRVLMLRDAAKKISNHFCVFPREMEELMRIPGVGHYTAAAVRNFAFNIPTPCLDTNIRRILHRTFIGPENFDGTWRKDDGYLLKLAGEVLNKALRFSDTANWHAALMDFGSLVCTKKNPRWDICPLTAKGLCKASYRLKNDSMKIGSEKRMTKKKKEEPGRIVGTRFVPNRIFRGKIIEELRDEEQGLSLHQIGRRVCLDWSNDHRRWLQEILQKLQRERFLEEKKGRFVLVE